MGDVPRMSHAWVTLQKAEKTMPLAVYPRAQPYFSISLDSMDFRNKAVFSQLVTSHK